MDSLRSELDMAVGAAQRSLISPQTFSKALVGGFAFLFLLPISSPGYSPLFGMSGQEPSLFLLQHFGYCGVDAP